MSNYYGKLEPMVTETLAYIDGSQSELRETDFVQSLTTAEVVVYFIHSKLNSKISLEDKVLVECRLFICCYEWIILLVISNFVIARDRTHIKHFVARIHSFIFILSRSIVEKRTRKQSVW